MYRLMGLKHRVLFASPQGTSGSQYDSKLVHGMSLHSLCKGISEKFAYVRQDLKPILSNPSVTDDVILEVMANSVSEEVARQAHLGQTHKTRSATVNATQQGERQYAVQPPAEAQVSVLQIKAEVQANRTAIQELTELVSALAKSIEKVLTPTTCTSEPAQVNSISTVTSPKSTMKGKCKACLAQGTGICNHCFKCGQEGHRAVGCLSKTKLAGNVRGSLKGPPVIKQAVESPVTVTSYESNISAKNQAPVIHRVRKTHAQKWAKRMRSAYEIATNNSEKSLAKGKTRKQTVTPRCEDNTDGSDEEYTYQMIPCYRLRRSQQTEYHQKEHYPQTNQRLNARAVELHPAAREEIDVQVQEENVPQVQGRACEDVAEEEESQDRQQESRVAEEDEHQVETKAIRRSQRTAQPRQMFTYGTLGQPSYQQWDAGVNSLMPIYPVSGYIGTVPLPYFIAPHTHYFNCFTQTY